MNTETKYTVKNDSGDFLTAVAYGIDCYTDDIKNAYVTNKEKAEQLVKKFGGKIHSVEINCS